MSLVGNLEDLGLGDILQIVSLSSKSGLLSLHSRGREGKIFFRNGQVVQATSNVYRKSLGEVLIQKGLLNQGQLRQALALQEREAFQERLGSVLVRCFDISISDIREVVREQIEKVVFSLFVWSEGTFEFDLRETVDALEHIRMDPLQFMLDEGLNPQYLAMEGSRLIDERRNRGDYGDDAVEQFELESSGDEEEALGRILAKVGRSKAKAARSAEIRSPVVVVDDDYDIREALGFVLAKGGYEPFLSGTGEEALVTIENLCRDGRPPLVVADLYVPRCGGAGTSGGMELVDIVRRNFPELYLIALSDNRNPKIEENMHARGIPCIVKPCREEISDPFQVKRLNELLLPVLELREQGTLPQDGTINLGSTLRHELGEENSPPLPHARTRGGLEHLRRMLDELNQTMHDGGIILMVLRCASEFMNRAVVFMVKKEEITGLGQFGLRSSDCPAGTLVKDLHIRRDIDTLLRLVIDTPVPIRCQPGDSPAHRYLFNLLGGGVPAEVFLGPIICEGKVAAILYGDNFPDTHPITDTEALEIFLIQAGLALEKVLLQRRLQGQGYVEIP